VELRNDTTRPDQRQSGRVRDKVHYTDRTGPDPTRQDKVRGLVGDPGRSPTKSGRARLVEFGVECLRCVCVCVLANAGHRRVTRGGSLTPESRALSASWLTVSSTTTTMIPYCHYIHSFITYLVHSVAEWLACWTQAQKGLGSNRSRDAVG